MRRAASADWPRLLTPAQGCYPLAVTPRNDERVLHIALRDNFEPQPALERALRSIASRYVQVDWQAEERRGHLFDALMDAAKALRPTLVFAQVQRANAIPGPLMAKVRDYCDPSCVVTSWDGDMHHTPTDKGREWFIELGRECDCNLTVETGYQAQYAEMGVRHPGYLQIGIEERWYKPSQPTPGVPPVVLLAGNYPSLANQPGGYATRLEIAKRCQDAYGPTGFGIYGSGWSGWPCARPFVRQPEEAGIYAAAAAALSLSIRHDLPRYTSDRLFRMLASGAVCLVKRFPDCEGLGLIDGRNCYVWSDWAELHGLLTGILSGDFACTNPNDLRVGALELSHDHTWDARMPELMACVYAVREARK
ncbi:MAG: hypothetical protein MUF54_07925 [Polyangiaceae bacterium]|jgi:hypothetical protein|nr:hypothetical protein [Polyangiaceae bacterium]